MLITVFTPVFNRAHLISRLYESLCRQTCKDFEWLVVNDGSTDNIDELMQRFIGEDKINIRYFKQPNGGKHRAINRGVREAHGEMFFIVDSDDYLTDDAVEWVTKESSHIIDDKQFVGISGLRIRPNGTSIVSGMETEFIYDTTLDIRFKHKITGDLAEVYKTEVLRKFPFPEFEGEKFCPEALVWNRIASSSAKIRLFNKPIYVCEYLNDGLTSNIVKIRKTSPKASMTHYYEQFNLPIPFKSKLKSCINFWRFATLKGIKDIPPQGLFFWLSSIIMFPLGRLMSYRDKQNL